MKEPSLAMYLALLIGVGGFALFVIGVPAGLYVLVKRAERRRTRPLAEAGRALGLQLVSVSGSVPEEVAALPFFAEGHGGKAFNVLRGAGTLIFDYAVLKGRDRPLAPSRYERWQVAAFAGPPAAPGSPRPHPRRDVLRCGGWAVVIQPEWVRPEELADFLGQSRGAAAQIPG